MQKDTHIAVPVISMMLHAAQWRRTRCTLRSKFNFCQPKVRFLSSAIGMNTLTLCHLTLHPQDRANRFLVERRILIFSECGARESV